MFTLEDSSGFSLVFQFVYVNQDGLFPWHVVIRLVFIWKVLYEDLFW